VIGGGVEDLQGLAGVAQPADELGETFEIDLSDALGGLTEPLPSSTSDRQPATAELERVFEDFREEAARKSTGDGAAQQYRMALAYREAGQADEAIAALLQAVRSPRHRFNAASLLGRLHRDQGRVTEAIEWLERAAQAPSPTPDAGYELLYDLGCLLDESGEAVRALAVFLELQAEVPGYRDVAARLSQLSQKA
jgi:tetratricopeptide (TPR) repeat protein